MEVTSSVEVISGVGPVTSKKLAQAGVRTVHDCFHYLPRTYNDFSVITPIAALRPGIVTVEGNITSIKGRYVRRGMHITEAIVSDDSGSVRIVWFNQPYREKHMKRDDSYFFSGEFKLSRGRLSILSPTTELASALPLHTARIIPVYREAYGVSSREMRQIVQACLPLLDTIPDPLPKWLVQKYKLMSYRDTITELHFPHDKKSLERARARYGFEEIFQLSLAALLNKQAQKHDTALKIPFVEHLAKTFVKELPFQLTDDQRKAIWRIYKDMQKTEPMNRLLEGDVGSGKTVVAAMAALMAHHHGFQTAIMAPTELLARQHAQTISALVEPLGLSREVGLLLGSLSAKQKHLLHGKITNGTCSIIVGTHALIAERVTMNRLGLIVVDEQHRFGVEQRKALQQKAGHMPHVLHMTATPIPRSLALTLYGELDISLLKEKPAGRLPITTKVSPPSDRPTVLKVATEQLRAGRQVYIVCPLIEPSEQLLARSATESYDLAVKKEFKDWRVGLLHGKLTSAEKESVMRDFQKHNLDVLVTTTVVEVGVDVPNATVMIIESAERFGLAQAHQLRGRIGRSKHPSFCYLVLQQAQAPSRRLRALEASQDGFRLAELDLELRGPGALYGTDQHGALDLRIAQLTDTALIESAREAAVQFIEKNEDLLHYSQLHKRVTYLRSVTNIN